MASQRRLYLPFPRLQLRLRNFILLCTFAGVALAFCIERIPPWPKPHHGTYSMVLDGFMIEMEYICKTKDAPKELAYVIAFPDCRQFGWRDGTTRPCHYGERWS